VSDLFQHAMPNPQYTAGQLGLAGVGTNWFLKTIKDGSTFKRHLSCWLYKIRL